MTETGTGTCPALMEESHQKVNLLSNRHGLAERPGHECFSQFECFTDGDVFRVFRALSIKARESRLHAGNKLVGSAGKPEQFPSTRSRLSSTFF